MPRLRAFVFPEEPHIERRQSCPQILSRVWTLSMPLSFLLHQQGEVEDDYVEDLPRGELPVPVVEVERASVLDSSPSVPPPSTLAPPRLRARPPRCRSHPSTSLPLLGIYWLS